MNDIGWIGAGESRNRHRLFTEPARPARIRRARSAPWLAVATVCIGAFMGQLDASIVTLALPRLRADLTVSLGAAEWVSLSYLLVLIGSVSAVGRLADRFGRKLFYTYGFGLFTIASLGCGLANSFWMLIAMRVLQALGAAMLQANSVALIRTTVSPDRLRRAIGLQGAAQAIGLALGPAVGGLLISAAGWRWVFYVNLPAGVIGITLGWLLLPRTRDWSVAKRFDWPGLLILLPCCTALLLGLSLIARAGMIVPSAVLLALAIAFAAWFVSTEGRSTAPLVDPKLFATGAFRAAVGASLLSYLVLFGVLFLSPLYLESAGQVRPAVAGLITTALPAGLGVAAVLSGRVHRPQLVRRAPSIGMAGCAVALAITAMRPGDRPVLVLGLAVAGIGLGLFTPANNAAIAGAGDRTNAGMVSGLLNMTRGIGTALGVAAAGSIFALVTASATGAASGSGSAVAGSGFTVTMIVLAGTSALVVPLAMVTSREK